MGRGGASVRRERPGQSTVHSGDCCGHHRSINQLENSSRISCVNISEDSIKGGNIWTRYPSEFATVEVVTRYPSKFATVEELWW